MVRLGNLSLRVGFVFATGTLRGALCAFVILSLWGRVETVAAVVAPPAPSELAAYEGEFVGKIWGKQATLNILALNGHLYGSTIIQGEGECWVARPNDGGMDFVGGGPDSYIAYTSSRRLASAFSVDSWLNVRPEHNDLRVESIGDQRDLISHFKKIGGANRKEMYATVDGGAHKPCILGPTN